MSYTTPTDPSKYWQSKSGFWLKKYDTTSPYEGYTANKKRNEVGYVDPYGMSVAQGYNWGDVNAIYKNEAAIKGGDNNAAGTYQFMSQNGYLPSGWDPGRIYDVQAPAQNTTTQAHYDAYAQKTNSDLANLLAGTQQDNANAMAQSNPVNKVGGFGAKAITDANAAGTNYQGAFNDVLPLSSQLAGRTIGQGAFSDVMPTAGQSSGRPQSDPTNYKLNTAYITQGGDQNMTPAARQAQQNSLAWQGANVNPMGAAASLTGIPQVLGSAGAGMGSALMPVLQTHQAGKSFAQENIPKPTIGSFKAAPAASEPTQAQPAQPAAYGQQPTAPAASQPLAPIADFPASGTQYPGSRTTPETVQAATSAMQQTNKSGANPYAGMANDPRRDPYNENNPELQSLLNGALNKIAAEKAGALKNAQDRAARGGPAVNSNLLDIIYGGQAMMARKALIDENYGKSVAWRDNMRDKEFAADKGLNELAINIDANRRGNYTAGQDVQLRQGALANDTRRIDVAIDQWGKEFNLKQDQVQALRDAAAQQNWGAVLGGAANLAANIYHSDPKAAQDFIGKLWTGITGLMGGGTPNAAAGSGNALSNMDMGSGFSFSPSSTPLVDGANPLGSFKIMGSPSQQVAQGLSLGTPNTGGIPVTISSQSTQGFNDPMAWATAMANQIGVGVMEFIQALNQQATQVGRVRV